MLGAAELAPGGLLGCLRYLIPYSVLSRDYSALTLTRALTFALRVACVRLLRGYSAPLSCFHFVPTSLSLLFLSALKPPLVFLLKLGE